VLVVRIYGGLGNQMFQYAAGLSISSDRLEQLMLDTSAFGVGDSKNVTDRNLDILDFNLNIIHEDTKKVAHLRFQRGFISKVLSHLNKKILNNYFYGFHPELYANKKLKYLDGYFQSDKYAEKINPLILKSFTLKPSLRNDISFFSKIFKENNFIAVHVRRGDYFNNPKTSKWYAICSSDYYQRGILFLKQHNPSFRIALFSDDIDWCRKNIPDLKDAFSISEYAKEMGLPLRTSQELVLMSQCRHFVISNSTFSWWGQYLCKNKNKMVVSPSIWNLNPRSSKIDLIHPSWYKINVNNQPQE